MAILHVYKFGTNTPPYATKATGATTIQAAIDQAAAGDTVRVHGMKGGNPPTRITYRENIKIQKALKLVGVPNEWPIIHGAGTGRVITVGQTLIPINGRISIENFEITGGLTSGYGGGIFATSCNDLLVQNNCIHHNKAGGRGGGIYVGQSNGRKAEIRANKLHDNSGLTGGAICKQGVGAGRVDGPNRSFIIAENFIGPGNSANHGAGIHIMYGDAVIEKNEISENRAIVLNGNQATGGGIAVWGRQGISGSLLSIYLSPWTAVEKWMKVKIEQNRIHDNRAKHDGGGVSVAFVGAAALKNNLIENNVALRDDAGGVYTTLRSSLRIADGNVIRGNQAQENGGGVHVTCVSRCLVSGNNIIENNKTTGTASGFVGGGGISVRHSQLSVSGTLILRGNISTGYGGGLLALTEDLGGGNNLCEQDTAVSLKNTLVDANTSTNYGSGIAIIKGRNMVPRYGTTIDGCVIRNNRSVSKSDNGILVFNPFVSSFFHFTPRIINCRISGHVNGANAMGVWIAGAGETRALIRGNVITDNHWGIYLQKLKGVQMKQNLLHGQRDTNLFADECQFSGVQHNQFSAATLGTGITRYGVTLRKHKGGSISRCNIVGHSIYGLQELNTPNGAFIEARHNYWGHARGPTQYAPLISVRNGDVIRQNVNWIPQQGTSFAVNGSAPAAISVPQIALPPAITFTMPSEYPGGLSC